MPKALWALTKKKLARTIIYNKKKLYRTTIYQKKLARTKVCRKRCPDDQFAKIRTEYGVLWYNHCNGGKKWQEEDKEKGIKGEWKYADEIPDDKYPSLNQIMSGLKKYLELFIAIEMATSSPLQ